MNEQEKSPPIESNLYEEALKKLLATAPTDILKLRAIIDARPSNWSPTSNAPYYNEKYGKQTQAIIEKLFSDRTQDVILDANRLKIKPETLRLQFQQGWQWLREQAPDPKCREYFTALKIGKLIDMMTVGPRIRIFIRGQETSELLASLDTQPSINVNAWREEFETWIAKEDKEDGEYFEKKDLRLSKDQLEWAANSLIGMDQYHIVMDKPNHFKVVYFNIEPANQ